MPLALVTGSPRYLGSAGAALGRAGFDVTSWEVASPLLPVPAPPAGPAPSGTTAGCPYDCYVQLPCGSPDLTGTRPAASDLVARIDALAAVVGRLSPSASILLAVEEPPARAGPGGPDSDLLASVAEALLEDLGRPAVRIAVVAVSDLCRAAVDGGVDAVQWEMPTPPLVSAP